MLDNTGDQSDVMSPLIELGSLLANSKNGIAGNTTCTCRLYELRSHRNGLIRE